MRGRVQYLNLNGIISDLLPVICGVPQGFVLEPTLFLLYTNDLPMSLPNTECVLFAVISRCILEGRALQLSKDGPNRAKMIGGYQIRSNSITGCYIWYYMSWHAHIDTICSLNFVMRQLRLCLDNSTMEFVYYVTDSVCICHNYLR